MKIFNWIFSSFFRTFGRFLFYLLIGVITMLLISGKVNAKTYNTSGYGNNSIIYTYPSSATNIYLGREYSTPYTITYMDLQIEANQKDSSYPNSLMGLTNGTYLYDFYIISSGGLIGGLGNCHNFATDFAFYDSNSGIPINSANNISSKCIDSHYTYINGVDAFHVLTQFTLSDIGEADPQLFKFRMANYVTGFVGPNKNYTILSGNIVDYDSSIVSDFTNQTTLHSQIEQNQTIINQNTETNNKLDTQINQNQTIIDQNNQTNEKIDDLNDNLTSTEGADLGALQNSAGWLPVGPVDSILNLPLSLLNNLTSNLNKSCQPVILPIPYVNEDLTLPCVNTLYDDMGISAWVTTIGVIASAFIMFSYLLKLYKWVDDTLSFRENNQIDNWGGI